MAYATVCGAISRKMPSSNLVICIYIMLSTAYPHVTVIVPHNKGFENTSEILKKSLVSFYNTFELAERNCSVRYLDD